MCGFGDKTCAVCYCGDGCIAGRLDDFWQQATKEQLIKRLMNGNYKDDTNLMKEKLFKWYAIDFNILDN